MNHRFATDTRIGLHHITIDVRARNAVCAETASHFICALASAAGVLEDSSVPLVGHDQDDCWQGASIDHSRRTPAYAAGFGESWVC